MAAFLFNSNGDAITVSQDFYDRGVRDGETLVTELHRWKNDRPITFAIPHLFSCHHFLLRQWLRPSGIRPGLDISLAVLPPSAMESCLKSGFIDGYCVGEPFNTEAVMNGSGRELAETARLSPMHPEKALLVSADFANKRSAEHLALIAAHGEAAAVCQTPKGREEAASILARPEYLGMQRDYIRRSLFAGSASQDRPVSVTDEELHVFSGADVNRPSADKANWIVGQLRLAGLLERLPKSALPAVDEIFREDIYDAASRPVPSKKSRSVSRSRDPFAESAAENRQSQVQG